MDKNYKITTPRYQQIAADVATKIADKQYKIGDKIYTRSSLASQYGVSPETARRAISILADMKIVETVRGSGVTILSQENATKFVNQFRDIKSVTTLKKEIIRILDRQVGEYKELKSNIYEMMDRIERFKAINPFIPFELTVEEPAICINRSLSDINFWHNTAATVIGIRHQDELLMSPGPYAVICNGDVLYFVGDDNCMVRVKNFLYGSD